MRLTMRAFGVVTAWACVGIAVGCAGSEFGSSGGKGAAAGTSSSGASGNGANGGGANQSGAGGTGGGSAGSGGGSARAGRGGRGGRGGLTGGSSGSGGSSAQGGTSGSGTGGTTGGDAGAGPSSCVTGDDCAPESAQCSLGGCCACSLRCENGVWGNQICPPCAAPICPSSHANDGDACDACQVPDGGCAWSTCDVDGPIYSGSCVDGHWSVTTQSCDAPGCCGGNADCASQNCIQGVCKDDAPNGCWNDDACTGKEICSGAVVCPCNARCDTKDAPGVCVPRDMGCCKDDNDCDSGAECIKGVCKTAATGGGCWADRDCGNGACSGASVCTCGAACLVADMPGACAIPL